MHMGLFSFTLVQVLLFVAFVIVVHGSTSQLDEQTTCLLDGTCANKEHAETTNSASFDEDYNVASCTNDDEDCEYWASLEPSECDVNAEFMHTNCRLACDLCNATTTDSSSSSFEEDFNESCTNDESDCEYWASLEPSECDVNPEYMHQHCRLACDACDEPLDIGVDQNMYEHDADLAIKVEELVNSTYDYMDNVVSIESKYDKVRHHCHNKEADCSYWAAIGECENNADWMASHCAPACQTCEKLLYEERCPMDNLGPDAWGEGDMHKMFEKITTDKEYQKYKPHILSRPSYPEGQSKDNTNYKIGPWVVILDDFATQDECERLIELGAEEGYKRSVEVGELNFDGSFEDVINDQRTSLNAWCYEKCSADPAAQAVVERIENLTGIPKNNSESLQLLRYEVGQYYNQHHDYIDFEKERQHGVRLMTLYLYLNDVEEGGGTRFPLLDLTVMPKRGRALLWPSVLNNEPDEIDERTEHQALPVLKGVKYGANAWLHQRDYVKPGEIGCD